MVGGIIPREPETANREPGTGNREPGTGNSNDHLRILAGTLVYGLRFTVRGVCAERFHRPFMHSLGTNITPVLLKLFVAEILIGCSFFFFQPILYPQPKFRIIVERRASGMHVHREGSIQQTAWRRESGTGNSEPKSIYDVAVYGSQFPAHSLRFPVPGSRFTVYGLRFTASMLSRAESECG